MRKGGIIVVVPAEAVALTGDLVGVAGAEIPVAVEIGWTPCLVGTGCACEVCLACDGCEATDVGRGEDTGVGVEEGVGFKSGIGGSGRIAS